MNASPLPCHDVFGNPVVLLPGARLKVGLCVGDCIPAMVQYGLLRIENLPTQPADGLEIYLPHPSEYEDYQGVKGGTFVFDAKGADVSISAPIIPGVPGNLQPCALNKQFEFAIAKRMGTRSPILAPHRILPKNKSLLKTRPLGDQSTSVLWMLNRVVGRFVDLAIRTVLTSKSWDVSDPAPLVSALSLANRNFAGTGKPLSSFINHSLTIASRDFSDCFSNLEHGAIKQAWTDVQNLLTQAGIKSGWVKPCDAGLSGARKARLSARWTLPPKPEIKTWVEVPVSAVAPLISFLLNDLSFTLGRGKHRASGKQLRGITMGVGAATALCR